MNKEDLPIRKLFVSHLFQVLELETSSNAKKTFIFDKVQFHRVWLQVY